MHGGGRRCEEPGCEKHAQGPKLKCKAHGGGRRCGEAGCGKLALSAGQCLLHGV